MCRLVIDSVVAVIQRSKSHTVGTNAENAREDSERRLIEDLARICPVALDYCYRAKDQSDFKVLAVRSLCNTVLHTVYMGTVNSSDVTSDRAKRLANSIGSYHCAFAMDSLVSAALSVFNAFTGLTPRFTVRGGCVREDLALQNLQARCRMVMAYLCAQLLPWFRAVQAHFALPSTDSEVPSGVRDAITQGATELQLQDTWGYLLVLGSGNVDEALRGYFTKYDCSSADINPIGGINKHDIKRMLVWAANVYHIPVFSEIAGAPPSVHISRTDYDFQ
jgi:NAD+ synthase (glutamine-hydrolysing)